MNLYVPVDTFASQRRTKHIPILGIYSLLTPLFYVLASVTWPCAKYINGSCMDISVYLHISMHIYIHKHLMGKQGVICSKS